LKLNEQKIMEIKRDFENALLLILKVGRVGEHQINVKINCGSGGGLSKARIGVLIDSPVEFG
jgi:hypothetical protein